MKSKHLKYVVTILLTLILGTVYLITDSKLYYYGNSYHNIGKKSLPFEFEPVIWSPRDCWVDWSGFLILNYGNLIAGKKASYEFNNNTIETNEIIKYGFNFDKEKIIVLIEDVEGDNYYIEFSRNTDPEMKNDFHKKVMMKETMTDVADYTWIEVKRDEERMSCLDSIRWICVLLFIISIPTILIGALILKKQKKLSKRG